jgi:hypothetical protein
MDELLVQSGLDAPHVALFKIGHDGKIENAFGSQRSLMPLRFLLPDARRRRP